MQHDPTVFIVDDDDALCNSLKWLLQSVRLNVETFNCAADYLSAYDAKRKGCLLIDVRMPQMSGLQLQEKLNELNNQLPILVMTGHGDIPIAVKAMKAGAVDFLTKPFNDQELIELIQKTIDLENKPKDVITTIYNEAEIKQRIATLTQREREIMQHVIAGKLNKQIAADLNISMSTVELHRSHVMQKMKAKTFADLVKMGMFVQI